MKPHSPARTGISVCKKLGYGDAFKLSTLRLAKVIFLFASSAKPYRESPLPPNTMIKRGVRTREFRFEFFGTESEMSKKIVRLVDMCLFQNSSLSLFWGEGGFLYSFGDILQKKTCLIKCMYEGRFLFSPCFFA